MMTHTIAIIFDFDDTLARDSTSSYLHSIGVDVQAFWKDTVQNLVHQDWDPIPAYLYSMIRMSQQGLCGPITQESLAAWGNNIQYYPGVGEIFDRLRAYASQFNYRIELEFYLISSGIATILRNTSVASQFTDIWGCDFAFDESGNVIFPKRIVSFTDKTRYIFHISKGLVGPPSRGRPFDVNRKVDKQHLRVPLNQMIFVGDGYTDIPCFSLVRKGGGIAIGVYDSGDRETWGKAWGFIEQNRVSNLVPADYQEGSALSNSLLMAVESMVRRVELHEFTYQG